MAEAEGSQRTSRVLVVDDEEAIRHLVMRFLRRNGFETVEAVDGQHAIDLTDAQPFDVVVVDLMMPRVDGFGVIEHLIRTNPAMLEKTIVMTAFPRQAARQRLNHLCQIVSKPFELPQLLALVQDCAAK